jgi:CheY-like chemotaxis protein
MMGGEIWVKSEAGLGSSFYFTVKFRKMESNSLESVHTKTMIDQEDLEALRGSRILLVEDNKINQLVVMGMLEDLGINVDIAENGQEALTRVQTILYDLILMDLQIPVMDGFEASKAIRRISEYKEVPIIALSAAVMQKDKELTAEVGMNAHLSKPIDNDRLIMTLIQWIKPTKTLLQVPKNEDKKIVPVENFDGIQGINIKELIDRIGNDAERMKRYLLYFCDEYELMNTNPDLLSVESEQFIHLIHKLRGISGNLSMEKIYSLTSEIESSNDFEKNRSLLPQLVELVQEIVQNIHRYYHDDISVKTDQIYNAKEVADFIQSIIKDAGHSSIIQEERILMLPFLTPITIN